MEDKEIFTIFNRAMDSDVELRSKKQSIERFINARMAYAIKIVLKSNC